MSKELFKPNVNEDLNRLHNVTLTEGQISNILYVLEGYVQDNDNEYMVGQIDPIFEELEGVVDKYYAKIEEAQSKQPTPEWED